MKFQWNNSTNKLATSEVNQTDYLQLLPVLAVIFLDSGSDSTLISKSYSSQGRNKI